MRSMHPASTGSSCLFLNTNTETSGTKFLVNVKLQVLYDHNMDALLRSGASYEAVSDEFVASDCC